MRRVIRRIKFNITRQDKKIKGNFNDNLKRNAKKMSQNMTFPEKQFAVLLEELGIKYEAQKIIGGRIYDFYIPETNTLYEIDGDFWHFNPKTMSESKKGGIQIKNISNDKYKDALAKGYGYSIKRVWESDLKNNYDKVKKEISKTYKKSI